MSNAGSDIQLNGMGPHGRRFHVPVKTGQTIYEGTMVAQQIADGLLVPATSAGTWPAFGKATATVTAATAGQRMVVETDRVYRIANAAGGDGFSEASQYGAPAYALDDHTVQNNDAAGTLQQCGSYEGMEADGMVRVKMSTHFSAQAIASTKIQRGRGTLVAGVLAVTGVTISATSRFFFSRVTSGGTIGDEFHCPDADRTVGALGTGSFNVRSFLDDATTGVPAAATSDTSTIDWIIVG